MCQYVCAKFPAQGVSGRVSPDSELESGSIGSPDVDEGRRKEEAESVEESLQHRPQTELLIHNCQGLNLAERGGEMKQCKGEEIIQRELRINDSSPSAQRYSATAHQLNIMKLNIGPTN